MLLLGLVLILSSVEALGPGAGGDVEVRVGWRGRRMVESNWMCELPPMDEVACCRLDEKNGALNFIAWGYVYIYYEIQDVRRAQERVLHSRKEDARCARRDEMIYKDIPRRLRGIRIAVEREDQRKKTQGGERSQMLWANMNTTQDLTTSFKRSRRNDAVRIYFLCGAHQEGLRCSFVDVLC